ncbi:C-type lectin domain family 7 member A-like isoform X1 [Trematomus bernacchii]|uniref:C-type lectin domain family 7 member A-like isoform X1 n=1 Tax=Trematomus bernacchii TaxID=40690 RepID=UPI00146A46B6|nr:C-type lectin domain family 7 member A-like isoform X1 [Trematomus bernacchii]XP_033984860.1 C-type lectin domain family 7 member A-like isoform X1 [Trematomus bernacchii]
MEEVYDDVDDVKTLSSRSSTIQEGPRRLLRASVLGLGLLSVFLLAGLIGLAVHYHNSVGGAAADLSAVKANLTERLQARDQLLYSVTEERDTLKANLTEKTREVDRLQSLSKQKKTCPAGWRMVGCVCYLLSTEKASWEQSRQNCRARGADLVIVDSNEEQSLCAGVLQVLPGAEEANQRDRGHLAGAEVLLSPAARSHVAVLTLSKPAAEGLSLWSFPLVRLLLFLVFAL